MQLRGAVAAAVMGFLMGGAGVRADQPAATQAPLSVRSPRVSPAPQGDAAVPVGRSMSPSQVARLAAAQSALQSRLAVVGAAAWNCGMPVLRPHASVDPRLERKPDARLAPAIRRAAPRSCGR